MEKRTVGGLEVEWVVAMKSEDYAWWKLHANLRNQRHHGHHD